MELPKYLRFIIYAIIGFFGLVAIMLVVITLVQIPIDLTDYKNTAEKIATDITGRKISIDNKIQVTTSLWPDFKIEGLRVGNPSNFKGDFARMQSARIQVSIIPLLQGKVHVKNFSVNGLKLALITDQNNKVNWTFRKPSKKKTGPVSVKQAEPDGPSMAMTADVFVVEKLNLNSITVSYINTEMSEAFEFNIDHCTGFDLPGKPMELEMNGSFMDEPFTASIAAASLQELVEQNTTWMKINIGIANADINLSGSIDLEKILHSLRLSASIEGRKLASFNRLLNIDLPPVPSYGAQAKLALVGNRLELSDFKVQVGNSHLTGNLTAVDQKDHTQLDIALISKMIQLNDFDFEDWSPFLDEANQQPQYKVKSDKTGVRVKASDEKQKDQADSHLEILSPDILNKLKASLNVAAENVLSGDDKLGDGTMKVSIRDGRIDVDPIELNIPGGAFYFSTSLKPGLEDSDATFKAHIDNFDVGVIARRADPKTNMGGTISLDVDLKSTASNFAELLSNSHGHFDFSARPVNIKAGIIDLWSVNLITAIASGTDKSKSQIECLVGRCSLKNGYMKTDIFVIDTSRMRICSSGWVDFKKGKLELTAAPTPKKPEFFSLATPMRVKGTFTDIKVGVRNSDLVGTAFNFITSPIHVPLRRMAGVRLPKDGRDVCGMQLGAKNRPKEQPPGCITPASTKK